VSDVRPTLLPALDAVVPVRSLADGKERLGPALDAEERETLILGMLLNTLEVLRAAPAVRRVLVVSRDEVVLALASECGANAVAEPAGGDLNSALAAGRDAALASGGRAVLYLPADLPLLGLDAVERLVDAADAALAAGGGRPLVVIAPADVGGGTNALLVSPPTVIDPSFGGRSFEAHARAAAAAEATVQVVVDPALGFDLDTPDDLERLDATHLLALIERGTQALVAGESA
jgi:2-phospho-L-lactate/phosphoenolpyruvate guanylyltransferase